MTNEIVISRITNEELHKVLKGLGIGETTVFENKKYTKTFEDCASYGYSDDWTDYEFSGKKIVGSYVKVTEVSAEDIETVIVGALEGGSNYWCGIDDTEVTKRKPSGIALSTWITQMLLEGETIHFFDVEDEEEKFILTLNKLIDGFKINAEKRPFDCDLEQGDATTSDCILQYGVFGELVYG